MRKIVVADFGRNNTDGKPGMSQEGFGFVHFFGKHKIFKGGPCLLSEQPGKIFFIQMNMFRDFCPGNIFIQIFLYKTDCHINGVFICAFFRSVYIFK